MNKIIRIFLILVIITCLFTGVAIAKKLDVKDKHGDNVGKEKNVRIDHTLDHDGHIDVHYKKTDENGQIDDATDDAEDKIDEGDEGRCDENNNGRYDDTDDDDCITSDPEPVPIPEFPTIALPIAAVIGMVFLFQNRNKKI
ncbi:MAG: PEF-CTERM sorting domain-containing protein [Candidatus Methanoperedens sp.]|nr:PEF-CTERM sorting domain-containing protein [Candidatus Methanoperedens sp.]